MNSNTGTSSTKGKRKADATMPRDNQRKCVGLDPILPSAKRKQTGRKEPTASDRDGLQPQSVSPMRSQLRPRPHTRPDAGIIDGCTPTSRSPKRRCKRKRTSSSNSQVEQNVTVEAKLEKALQLINELQQAREKDTKQTAGLLTRVEAAEKLNAELATMFNNSEQKRAEFRQEYDKVCEKFKQQMIYVENMLKINGENNFEQMKRLTYVIRRLNGVFVWAQPIGGRGQEGRAVNLGFEMPSPHQHIYDVFVFNSTRPPRILYY